MVDEGTIIGSVGNAFGTSPGEPVLAYYHGNVQDGFEMITYLSEVTTYMVSSRHQATKANDAYTVSVHTVATGGNGYRKLTLGVYGANTAGELDMGGIDVSVWVLGSR